MCVQYVHVVYICNMCVTVLKGSPMAHASYSHLENIRAAPRSPVLLTFRAVAYPIPQSSWQKLVNDQWEVLENTNGTIISVSKDGLTFGLTIPTVSTSDYGTYSLHLENERGGYNVTFHVSSTGNIISYILCCVKLCCLVRSYIK